MYAAQSLSVAGVVSRLRRRAGAARPSSYLQTTIPTYYTQTYANADEPGFERSVDCKNGKIEQPVSEAYASDHAARGMIKPPSG